ncbi:MAG: RDD family protein [Sulfuritalea sp.]|nr:RDD family protein [Sulfuritalea sp.]
MFYEGLLVAGIVGVLVLLLTAFSALSQRPAPVATIRALVFLALAIYFLWHWQDGRQTLPMRTWHLHLVDRLGRPPALILLAWRYVLAWPSIGLGLGILWALVDRDRQFLHDRLAGTRLIYAPPAKASPPPPAGK